MLKQSRTSRNASEYNGADPSFVYRIFWKRTARECLSNSIFDIPATIRYTADLVFYRTSRVNVPGGEDVFHPLADSASQ